MPKRRGRPPKQRSAPVVDSIVALGAEGSSQDGARAERFLRPGVGLQCYSQFVALCQQQQGPGQISLQTQQIWDAIVGKRPRKLLPKIAEAESLGLRHDQLRLAEEDLAMMAYLANRSWIASLVSHLHWFVVHEGKGKDQAICTFAMYDGVDLTFRASDFKSVKSFPDVPALTLREHGLLDTAILANAPRPKITKMGKQLAKIMQFQGSLSFSVLNYSDMRYKVIEAPLVCPLLLADRMTAETVKAMNVEQMAIPFLEPVRDKWKSN